jgi:hypothetical protein
MKPARVTPPNILILAELKARHILLGQFEKGLVAAGLELALIPGLLDGTQIITPHIAEGG